MLFKLHDRKNKFMQYVSCCIDEEDIVGGVYAKIVMKCLHKIKYAKLAAVVDCQANTYSWTYSPLEISCFIEPYKYEFKMVEVPSTTRNKSFKRSAYWASMHDVYTSSPSVVTVNGAPGNYLITNAVTTTTASTSYTYTYNPPINVVRTISTGTTVGL